MAIRVTHECGFDVTASTQAKADWALRRHVCTRHIANRERAERVQARKEAVKSRPRKPCHHKYANHQHGTHACYVLDKCRCLDCTCANSAYEENRQRQQAYGRWNGLVDAEPARSHCKDLMAQGMGLKKIAAAAGLPHGALSKLVYGFRDREPSKRIRPATEEKVLAVKLRLAGGARVDGLGTRRRLQALVAIGYSMASLGERIELSNIHRVIHGHGDGDVLKATKDAVAALYDELSMTPNRGTDQRSRIAVSRARRYAKDQGWVPPLAWDDGDLDDPDATPDLGEQVTLKHVDDVDEAAILRRMDGDKKVRLSDADKDELIRRWVAAGRSLNECERITGLKVDRYFRFKDQEDVA